MKVNLIAASKVLIGTFFLFTSLYASARTLTPEEALSRVYNTEGKMKLKALSSMETPSLYKTFEAANKAAVYLFTQNNSKEYLVVSADDNAQALLGYGNDFTDINPTMQWWIEEYGRQIEWVRTHGAADTQSTVHSLATTSYAPISPLVKTKWNQDAPFNNDCPTYQNQKCVTGCVATAMAQVMNYHRWPQTGTGNVSYTTSNGIKVTANFSSMTFDWTNMLDVYGSNATTAQNNAVAQLMFACGASVQMDYSPSASSATSLDAASALINNFGYDKGIMYYDRDFYGLDEWNDLVYNQLVNYGPVQYSGQSNGGGHSFVCDGYESDGYFHFNWGWGGMSDGYFLLTALNPGAQGIGGSNSGYNFMQDIIGNVKPAVATSSYAVNFATNSFVPSVASTTAGTWFTVPGSTYNYTLTTLSQVNFGVKLVSTTGAVTYGRGQSTTDFQTGYGVSNLQYIIPTGLTDGTYQISPAVQVNNVWYDVLVQVGAPNVRTFTKSGNKITFGSASKATLTVDNIEDISDFYIGSKFEIKATVNNIGDAEHVGYIYLALFNSAGTNVGRGGFYPIDMNAGNSSDIDYISDIYTYQGYSITSGSYIACFADESGNIISDYMNITINAASTPTVTLKSFTVEGNPSNSFVTVPKNNFNLTADVSVSSGYFGNTFTVYIFPYPGGTSVASYTTDPVFLSAGQSTTLSIPVDFSNGETGTQYMAGLYYNSTSLSQNKGIYAFFKLGDADQSGAGDIEVSTEPVTTEYYTLSGVKLNNIDNVQAGLYIVRKKMNDGTVATEKVFVP